MRTPKKRTVLVCLILFILGIAGYFIPLYDIPLIGSFINRIAVYLLIAGYGLLLAAIYIL